VGISFANPWALLLLVPLAGWLAYHWRRRLRERGDARGRITTSYCPEVGIVSLLVEEWHGADQISQLTELRAFGPPTDLR